MFEKSSADKIRESLLALDFNAKADNSELVRSYIDFYAMDFSSSSLPIRYVIGSFDSGPYKIVAQYFDVSPAAKRGTVFLLHGYFDHAGLYGNLIRHFLEQGFAVAIFDLPGHGLSSGKLASIESFRDYDRALLECLTIAETQQLSQPWILAGQSTGAAVIVDSILEDNLPEKFKIANYILLAPLVQPRYWGRSSILFQISRWFVSSTKRSFTQNSHDEEFLRFLENSDVLQARFVQTDWVHAMIDYLKRYKAAEPSDVALHIIQGSGDDTVDWESNLPSLLEKFPDGEVHMVPEARHHLVNESAEFRRKVFTLIDEILSGLS